MVHFDMLLKVGNTLARATNSDLDSDPILPIKAKAQYCMRSIYCIHRMPILFSVTFGTLAVPLNVFYVVSFFWIVQHVIWSMDSFVMDPFLHLILWSGSMCRCYTGWDYMGVLWPWMRHSKSPQLVVLTEAVQAENKNSYPVSMNLWPFQDESVQCAQLAIKWPLVLPRK